MKSKSWDTRTAAAKAIGGIAENAPSFDPNAEDTILKDETVDPKTEELSIKTDENGSLPLRDDQLQLETLDIASILLQGKKLLGSAGKEYDYFLNAMDPSQRLAHQKKTLSSRLGLGGEYTEEELIDDSDVKSSRNPMSPSPAMRKIPSMPIGRSSSMTWGATDDAAVASQEGLHSPGEDGGLSKRQLNMLKRKNKKELKTQASKVRVVDLSERRPSQLPNNTPHAPLPHAIKSEDSADAGSNGHADYFSLDRPDGDDDGKSWLNSKDQSSPSSPNYNLKQTRKESNGHTKDCVNY